MLRIDRVKTELELLPRPSDSPTAQSAAEGLVSGPPAFDAAMKERLRDVVLEILREHFRQLERRGIV